MIQEWNAIYIDDDLQYCKQAMEQLNSAIIGDEGQKLTITTDTDFQKGLSLIEKNRFDFVILDVRLVGNGTDEEAGIKIFNSIKSRRFVPVIFYTAFAYKVEDLETDLVRVIRKTEGFVKVLDAIKELLQTQLPLVNRAIVRHVDEVQRDYMWEFVSNNWGSFQVMKDKVDIAYLLARRLAATINKKRIYDLARDLGANPDAVADIEKVHPAEYYIVPPVTERCQAGDIIEETISDGVKRYHVVLNPTCDFVNSKVEWIVFAKCCLLTEQSEYVNCKANINNSRHKASLESLLRDNRQDKQPERFYCLPGAFQIPGLIADFQQIETIKLEEYNEKCRNGEIKRIASLDSPFAESLLNRFTRYAGRIGKPDLDTHTIIKQLE